MFSGNSIQFKKVLRIPIDAGVPISVQEDTEEVLMQRFKNISQETSIEARVYLQENDWNLEKALTAWKGDESWATTHVTEVLPSGFSALVPAASGAPQLRPPVSITPEGIKATLAAARNPTLSSEATVFEMQAFVRSPGSTTDEDARGPLLRKSSAAR